MTGRNGPTVSIGVPVFNGENYLDEALEALLGQTFGDIELVLADNASTDGTEEIARRFQQSDSRVRYFRHDANLGAAPNYNFTLSKATGEFFMWAAHDDLRAPQYLEYAMEEMQRIPNAGSVFSRAVRIDARGDSGRDLTLPAELTSGDPAKQFRAAITCTYPAIVVFGLMRKDTLDQTRRHGNYPGADRVLAAELALMGPFVQIDEPLFFSRDHPDRYVRIKQRGGRLAQSQWWDANRTGTIDVPSWKRLRSYWAAPRLAGLSAEDRRRCHLALLRAVFDNRAGIARDLASDTVRAVSGRIRQMAPPVGGSRDPSHQNAGASTDRP